VKVCRLAYRLTRHLSVKMCTTARVICS
jgi:hypothetical protein